MRNQRILITGGAGLVGSHLADRLVAEEPREIRILDNFVRGRREYLDWACAHGPVTVVKGDVREAALVRDVMGGVDLVFHQAAIRIIECADDPRQAFEVLCSGTFNVLEAAVKAKVGMVVAASSASIYGLAESFPTREAHHPYNNRTLYGAAKAFNEGLLRSFRDMYGLRTIALRYFNVYGPRMDAFGVYTEVLVRWMERIAAGQPPIIFGDGRQTLDFVHVNDVARANVLAARAQVDDDVFNVGSGQETTLFEAAQLLLEIMGSSLTPEFAPQRRVNPVPRRLADVTRAREGLGFHAAVPLRAGLQGLVAWWQQARLAPQV